MCIFLHPDGYLPGLTLICFAQLHHFDDVLPDISTPSGFFGQLDQDVHLELILRVLHRNFQSTAEACRLSCRPWISEEVAESFLQSLASRGIAEISSLLYAAFLSWRTATKNFTPLFQVFVLLPSSPAVPSFFSASLPASLSPSFSCLLLLVPCGASSSSPLR